MFFIFLYQRWIYRVDPRRVNEFGTSGVSAVGKPRQDPLEADSSGVEGGKEGDTEPNGGPREGDTEPTGGPREGDTEPTGGPREGGREGGGTVRKRTTAARS